MRFHLTPKGEAKPCRAEIKCRFGSLEADHFPTAAEARARYEIMQELEAKKDAVGTYKDLMEAQFQERRSTYGGRSRELVGSREIYIEASTKLHQTLEEIDTLRERVAPAVEPHVTDFPQVIGLEYAQETLMTKENLWSDGSYFYVEDLVPHMREVQTRYLNGEILDNDDRIHGWFTPGQRLLADLHQGGTMGKNFTYTVLIFPEKDLRPVLERLGVDNVSVSYFQNGRENGLVYSVQQPDGSMRSFSVYEHRNTDSICINGCTDWDPETEKSGPRPREAVGSRDFFAEMAQDDRRQQAETLGYFLREAQMGRLEDDTTLMMKAEKLDWDAILAKQVPGFGEWAQGKGWNPDAKREFE